MAALLVFIIANLEMVLAEKNYWTQKLHLAITLSKIRLDILCQEYLSAINKLSTMKKP